MRETVTLLRREFFERRLFFLGAALGGIMTLFVPLLPQLRDEDPMQVINTTCWALSLATLLTGAFLSGAAAISSDLSERRMSFFFARPLSTSSIWISRVSSALLIPAIVAVIVMLPATIIGGGLLDLDQILRRVVFARLLVLPLLVVFLIGLGHHLGLVMRARSSWILLDFLGIPFFLLVAWLSMRPFVFGGAFNLVASYLLVLLVVGTIAFLASSYSGLSVGRVDIKTVQRITSLTFITLLGLATMMLAFHSEWVRAADPDEMSSIWPTAAGARGDWMIAQGMSSRGFDFAHGFLINASSGEFIGLRTGQIGRNDVSRDGSRAIWEEIVDMNPLEARLYWADLHDNPQEVRSEISYDWNASRGPSLSPSGRRVALIIGDLLAVHDLDQHRSILSIRLHDAAAHEVWFKEDGLIRLYRFGSREEYEGRRTGSDSDIGNRPVEIFELDLATRQLKKTGEFPWGRFSTDHAHDRLLLVHARDDTGLRFSILDARTGDPIVSRYANNARLLADGVVFLNTSDHGSRLEVLDLEGTTSREIDLPGIRSARLGGEPQRGSLCVAVSTEPPPDARTDPEHYSSRYRESEDRSALLIIDLASGEQSELGRGLIPVTWRFWYSDRLGTEAGSLSSRLFIRDQQLLLMDSKTYELKNVGR